MKNKAVFIAFFFTAFILGMGTMNLFYIHTLDRLHRIQNQLSNQLLDREIRLERLNESINKQKTAIVKDIQIYIEFDGNPLVKDNIEKVIHFYLSDLVGKELQHIDGEMIYKIIHQRIINIDDRQVQLFVKYVIINESLSISVKAHAIP